MLYFNSSMVQFLNRATSEYIAETPSRLSSLSNRIDEMGAVFIISTVRDERNECGPKLSNHPRLIISAACSFEPINE